LNTLIFGHNWSRPTLEIFIIHNLKVGHRNEK
jgi:hypothetical protein